VSWLFGTGRGRYLQLIGLALTVSNGLATSRSRHGRREAHRSAAGAGRRAVRRRRERYGRCAVQPVAPAATRSRAGRRRVCAGRALTRQPGTACYARAGTRWRIEHWEQTVTIGAGFGRGGPDGMLFWTTPPTASSSSRAPRSSRGAGRPHQVSGGDDTPGWHGEDAPATRGTNVPTGASPKSARQGFPAHSSLDWLSREA
jgi:hypothetical protein